MTSSNFQVHLNQLRKNVEVSLEAELHKAAWPEKLKQAVAYSLMAGGKRLRPVLVLLANDVCGGVKDDALPAACAVEMIHTYSLIHDDLPSMDDDDFRRGRLTCHKVFGEAMAILAGDCLLTLAFETIAAGGLAPDRIAEQTRVLAFCAGGAGMVGGQVLDVEAACGPENSRETCKTDSATADQRANTEKPVIGQSTSMDYYEQTSADRAGQENRLRTDMSVNSRGDAGDSAANISNRMSESGVEELNRIHCMKTGALISGALELGAISAGVDVDRRQRLRHYGNCIGLAFQIADDLLDVTGCHAKLGKQPGRDQNLGKLTYPRLLGVEASRRKAEGLVDEACETLNVFGQRGEWLKKLAKFVVERDH